MNKVLATGAGFSEKGGWGIAGPKKGFLRHRKSLIVVLKGALAGGRLFSGAVRFGFFIFISSKPPSDAHSASEEDRGGDLK